MSLDFVECELCEVSDVMPNADKKSQNSQHAEEQCIQAAPYTT